MWTVIGSWLFVGLVGAVGFAITLAAWMGSDRGVRATWMAAGAFVVAGLALAVVMTLPVTVDGTTCNQRATPEGVNRADFDAQAEADLRESGTEVDRYECRDAVRGRFLLGGAGFLVLTFGGAALVARRPKAGARD